MNLIMLDIDGTLTQSYEYDQEVFSHTISEVTGVPFHDTNWHSYEYITSSGVTPEAIYRATGRSATSEQVEAVERTLLWHLEQRHQKSPSDFTEIPGAAAFISSLKCFDDVVVSIATGCWHSEAIFKLKASNINVAGIPMATCDDSKSREEIMAISAQRALTAYQVSHFDRIVYIGDGVWDMKASKSLGYGFIGVGARLQLLRDRGIDYLHEDYTELSKVLLSIEAVLAG